MNFVIDIFIKFWKEVIVAVLLTATLPFKERERLKAALSEAEGCAESERRAREELERKLEAETADRQKAVDEAENMRVLLEQERKAHDEAERKFQAEVDEKRKAQEEAESLRVALEQEQKAREQAERSRGDRGASGIVRTGTQST